MKISAALAALVAIVGTFVSPAFARSDYVQDQAALFSAATVSSLNASIGSFNQETGKEVVVVTVPSLTGTTAEAAAEKAFADQRVNGVLVFLAKAEHKQGIIPDRKAAAFFPPGEIASIRSAMRGYFRSGDFDTGITTGVNLIISQYRSHERSLAPTRSGAYAPTAGSPSTSQSFGGGGMSLLWLILILIAGFMIIRAIFRAMSGPRRYPPGYGGGPGPGYGAGMGMGGPGYGGGYGGGGGGFFSGLLGGLGGAFLGNELFGRHDGGGFGGGNEAGVVPDQSYQQDASGWQNDAGQADMSNASFGDYGSSGGGFDGGGGGGDFGGGGDSGGGW